MLTNILYTLISYTTVNYKIVMSFKLSTVY